MKEHEITITPTDFRGVDSGRVRYRIVCTACQVVVHEATTGPIQMLRAHFEGSPGYEQPLCPKCCGTGWCENYHGNGDVNRRWRCECQRLPPKAGS